jgi:hypothetical protein
MFDDGAVSTTDRRRSGIVTPRTVTGSRPRRGTSAARPADHRLWPTRQVARPTGGSDDREPDDDDIRPTRMASTCAQHDWPPELDGDASCERCGLAYAEFSR